MYKKIIPGIIVTVMLVLCATSCVFPYDPEELSHKEGVLVVEGNISVTGPFTIQITRTAVLPSGNSTPGSIQYERNAVVYVKDNQGNTYKPLSHSVFGEYYFDFSDQSPDLKSEYRLVVESEDGHVYESDWRQTQQESNMELHYKIDTVDKKVIIYADAYDITGEATHFNWKFVETWDYVSQVMAIAYLDGNKVIETENFRPWMYRCWDSRASSEILLVETSALSENTIKDFVIQTLEYRDIRITQHYSIEVIQTVLDKDAYYYLQNMKKNSNDIGGLFSPQPHELSGNIKCSTDPSIRAVGFVSVCNSVSKRLFIDCTGLPGYVRERLPEDKTMPLNASAQSLARLKQEGYSPYMVDPMANASVWNLTRCIDCRSKGGKPEVPSFWPPKWPTY